MIQDFVVLIIIASVIGYVIYTFVMSLKSKKEQSRCVGCKGCELSKDN